MQTQLPEWSALLAGALLIDGSAAQKSLARQTLLESLSSTWGLGSVDVGPGYSVEDVFPATTTGRFGILIGTPNGDSQLRTFEVHTGQFGSMLALKGTYWYADSIDSGRRIAVVGPLGAAFVTLPSRTVSRVRGQLTPIAARLSTDGVLSIATANGQIYAASARGSLTSVGHYENVLDLERTSAGGVNALVETAPGAYEIVDAGDGAVMAHATLPPPVLPAGGLSPDGDTAYVLGADDQLWSFTEFEGATPLGIPVTDRTNVVHALPGGRIIVGGDTEPAVVYYLPTGADLGQVCQDAPRLNEIRSFPDSAVVACEGGAQKTFWSAPSGPLQAPPSRLSNRGDVHRNGLSILTRGGSIRFSFPVRRRKRVTSRWLALFPDPIVASAISPNASQVIVASSGGQVAIFSIAFGGVQVAGLWTVPGHVAARSVSLSVEPVVLDVQGNAWLVPDCHRCNTDAGLLAQLSQRLSGCWLNHQLTSISQTVRNAFHIQLCRPLAAPVGT